VLQAYVSVIEPPLAVSVALAPVQIVPSLSAVPEVSATEIDAVGSALTIIVVDEVSVQPSELVTVTVYVSSAIGDTLIAAVVCGGVVLQLYDVPPLAVSVALSPVQIVPSLLVVPDVSATVIIGIGSALTVIVEEEVAVHPSAFVTVTVYVVFVLGETVIAAVVCGGVVFQLYEVPPLAVSVALSPVQIVPSSGVMPDISVTTMDGVGSATTVTVAVVAEEQLLASVTVTV